MKPHTAFFGDGEHAFALTHPAIHELEHKTGTGIGALFTRMQRQDYRLIDILETIRCALIGAGTSPAEADRLIKAYGEPTPKSELYVLALSILTLTFFGPDDAHE